MRLEFKFKKVYSRHLTLEYKVPQAFFVIWTTSPDVDLRVVLLQPVLGLSDGSDDALESVSHVGEVGDAAADDQDLTLGMGVTTH